MVAVEAQKEVTASAVLAKLLRYIIHLVLYCQSLATWEILKMVSITRITFFPFRFFSYLLLFPFSMFANICTSAASENPHVTLNKFFSFQELINQSNGTSTVPHTDKLLNLYKVSSLTETEKNDKKSVLVPGKISSKSPKYSPDLSDTEKQEWATVNGLKEINELREVLVIETKSWFLKYLEKTLDVWFSISSQEKRGKTGKDTAGKKMNHANHIALTLSLLKQANEWLEKLRNTSNMENEALLETVDRLKQKVYSCLLLHVDSAAFALENRA